MNDRYSRQMILPEIGEKGQEKLSASHVAIIGCGGLGAIAGAYLAGAGIGHITLVDGDFPHVSNLHRQVFFTDQDTQPKAAVLKKRLEALNPEIKLEAHHVSLSKDNIDDILTSADLVLECTDDQMCKYLVNDFCSLEGIPLVYGAIHKFEGYVSLFENKKEDDIHLRDIFPVPDLNVPVCSEVGVLNTIAGMIGILQANEAMKYLLQIGESLHGRLLTYDILSARQMILALKKNWNEDLELLYESTSYLTPACDHITEMDIESMLDQRAQVQLISVMSKSEHQAIDEETTHSLEDEISLDILDRTKGKVIVYCRSGRVSRLVASSLLLKDPTIKIYSLKGGYHAFQRHQNNSSK